MSIFPRHKKSVSIICAALVLGTIAFSGTGGSLRQDEPLARIRNHWAQVQERIALAIKEAESGSPSGFYASEIFINRHNGSWRASGTYSKKTVFWYTDQPEFAERESGGALSVLQKIEIQEIVGARTFYREFLFDGGKLVFAFVQSPGETGPAAEHRYYFSEGSLFRYQEGPRLVEAKTDASAVKAEAAELQKLFLATF